MTRRAAFMLIELLIVMAVLGLLMSLSAAIILGIMRTYEADAGFFQRGEAQDQLADTFRRDVAAARAAPGRAGVFTASSRCLILRLPDHRLVVYEATDAGVQRTEIVAEDQAQRLLPLGSKRARVAFERTDECLLTLQWTESRGLEDAPLEQTSEYRAALGGDLR
jgi:hypothetical protein